MLNIPYSLAEEMNGEQAELNIMLTCQMIEILEDFTSPEDHHVVCQSHPTAGIVLGTRLTCERGGGAP